MFVRGRKEGCVEKEGGEINRNAYYVFGMGGKILFKLSSGTSLNLIFFFRFLLKFEFLLNQMD